MTVAGEPTPTAGAAPAGQPESPAGIRAPLRAGDLLPARLRDLAVRCAGGLVSLAGGLLLALLSVVTVPWRIDAGFAVVRVPLAVVFAAAGAVVLVWFAPRASGTRWAVLLPALGWFTVVVRGVWPTVEGSRLVITDDLVAAFTLAGGSMVFVAGVMLALISGAGQRSAG